MNDQHFQQLILRRIDEMETKVLRRLEAIEYGVGQLILGANAMANSLDDLTAQVTANTNLEQSAITMIKGLASQIAAAGTDPAKLSALTSQLHASADALAAAIAANTPAAPSSTPAPTA